MDPASDDSRPATDGTGAAEGFAEALRAAVKAKGLGLDRLSERLAERGAPVSVATLSFWQSGRRSPGRQRSIAALTQLEDILELAPGALVSLVRHRSQDPRRVDPTRTMAESLGDGVALPRTVAELDARIRHQLETVTEHATVQVGPDRSQHSRTTRRVLRALSDGVDRMLIAVHIEDEAAPPTRVEPLAHCTLGRRHWLEASSYMITELMLERRLDKGDLVLVEYRLVYGPPYPYDTVHEERKQSALREFALTVAFDPAAVPDRCEWYELDSAHPYRGERVTPVSIGPTGSVVVVREDLQPSTFGMRWFFDEPRPDATTPTPPP